MSATLAELDKKRNIISVLRRARSRVKEGIKQQSISEAIFTVARLCDAEIAMCRMMDISPFEIDEMPGS